MILVIISPAVYLKVCREQVHPGGHHTNLVHNGLEEQEPPGGVLPLQVVLHQTLAPLMVGVEVVTTPTTVEQGEGPTTDDNHRGTEMTMGSTEPEVEVTDALLVMEDVDPQELVEEVEVRMILVILVDMEVMAMITNPPKLGPTTRMSITSSKDKDGCLKSIYVYNEKLRWRIE